MPLKYRQAQLVNNSNVTRHTHFVHIESFRFDFRSHTQSDGEIDRLEDDISEDSDHDDVGADADALRQELRSIAIEQSANWSGDAVPAIAICSVREKTESQTSKGAVHAMDSDGAHRIVDF